MTRYSVSIQKVLRSTLVVVLHACLVLAGFAAGAAHAAGVPQRQVQVPGYYRAMVGTFEVTALYDGAIDLDTKVLKGADADEVRRLHARLFVDYPSAQTAVNAYLVNTGDRLVLIDAGVGATKLFGSKLGHIDDNLRAAGYTPDQVDTVLLTHLHPDHVNGLVTADGKAFFPNAEIWSAKDDNDFWLDPAVAARMPKEAQVFFTMASAAAAPYVAAGRWKTFDRDQDIVPGIMSVAAHGHTPGHSAYMLMNGGQRMLIWGDLVHNHAVQFAHPDVAIEFDVDQKQAIEARAKLFARAANERLLVGGMHLPFPGIGHVRADGNAYAWVPAEFAPVQGPALSPRP